MLIKLGKLAAISCRPSPKKLQNTSFLDKNLEIFFALFPGFKKVFSYHHAKMLGYYFSLFS